MPHAVDMHYRYRIRLDAREEPWPVETTEYVRFESALHVVRKQLAVRPALLAQIERAEAIGARRETWACVWQTPAVRAIYADRRKFWWHRFRGWVRSLVGKRNSAVVKRSVSNE